MNNLSKGCIVLILKEEERGQMKILEITKFSRICTLRKVGGNEVFTRAESVLMKL